MKTSEAIASLKTLCNTCTMFPKCVNNKPECFQAIEMAISALEKQEVDKCCETCKHKRHTAIEWPCRECYMSLCDIEDYYEPYTEEEA